MPLTLLVPHHRNLRAAAPILAIAVRRCYPVTRKVQHGSCPNPPIGGAESSDQHHESNRLTLPMLPGTGKGDDVTFSLTKNGKPEASLRARAYPAAGDAIALCVQLAEDDRLSDSDVPRTQLRRFPVLRVSVFIRR